ncbi:hypothetical protein ACEWY4_013110 [Coilia grayii]|uniref:Calmodulin-binding transcription activator 1 n=1 Tax=Coilia grayii TaxID=363190 RepID=A0ABD1JVH2_9TELE
MADSPVVSAMAHVSSVMGSLSQSSVFMSEVSADPVYSMSPTGGANAHLLGADATPGGLVLAVAADGHKFAFPGAVGVGLGEGGSADGLAMLSAGGVSEELVLSSSLDTTSIKLPETTMNFDPDCFLNNPKQGQTYGGNGLKTENVEGGLSCSSTLPDTYGFSSALVKNIKTEDTSFEQQLAKESGFQVGEVGSGGGVISGLGGGGGPQSSLALTPTNSLLPTGGGLSPSTTLEQMDFSAIDAKQDYSSTVMSAAGYTQTLGSPHLPHQSHSPSFFLQSSPQSSQAQGLPSSSSNGSGSSQGSQSSGGGTYMALPVVKSDSPSANGTLRTQHQAPHGGQHGVAKCNGASPAERNGPPNTLQLLQFQSRFSGSSAEAGDVGGLKQNGGGEEPGEAGRQDGRASDGLLKAGDGMQMGCRAMGTEAGGAEAVDHYLQSHAEGNGVAGAGGEAGALCNGTDGTGAEGSPHSQLPLLQGTGLVQGLFSAVTSHQGNGGGAGTGGTMEINLDHFDVSFGNQFSDLINDFISVDGGASGGGAGAGGGGANVGAGSNELYAHQLLAHSGAEGQVSSGATSQQAGEEGGGGQPGAGYSSGELCLQPCCSPQAGTAPTGPGDASQLAYMQVAEVASAGVAHGTMEIIQATGRLFVVTDYSPEWSYPEGGVKVLITGPWQEASSDYSCLFDQITVPASLIQPGVLRCYCPAHDTGLVTLQVAVSGQIISNSVVFEYKARALPALPSSQHDWLSLDDNQFKMSILERLEQMERRMAEMAGQQQSGGGSSESGGGGRGGGGGGGGGAGGGNDSASQSQGPDVGKTQAGSSFEGRVVVVCEKMMNRACWAKSKHLIHSKTFRGMTLLHLAAAQGYATLIQTLIKWRTKHADSIDLELEVDPLNVDHFSCTPLMWACALGHVEAALLLYKWDRRALAIPDSLGRLPLAIARSRGHTRLAECLEHLQRDEQQQQHQQQQSTSPSLPFSPGAEGAHADSWVEVWGGEALSGSLRATPNTSGSSSLTTTTNQDLRRPRSEPSSYYASEAQGDAPVTKRHKPNPEALGVEQLSQRPKSSPPKGQRDGGSDREARDGGQAGARQGASTGRQSWKTGSGRKATGGGSLGKERLATRLRMQEASGTGDVSELLSGQENMENTEDLQMNMMTLAEHIIEATPDRIKRENFVPKDTTPVDSASVNSTVNWLASYLGDAERFPYNKLASTIPGLGSCSSGGPTELEGSLGKLGLPSLADWTAFLSVSHSKAEQDLAQLALSDPEQRELYEAARQVQSTFRKYKGQPLREQQEVAAAVIQRCYKKYKQLTWIAFKYALYKKMTLAAILIQSKFRSYHEQKKFQQSRRAAILIQQYYRSYKELGHPRLPSRARAAALVQHKLRSSLWTKRQDQAARKIMRFLLRCRHSPLMDHRLFKRGERIEKGQGT